MRGIGILDLFMVVLVMFLLLMLVIVVGLIDTSGATVFTVEISDALATFAQAQYGKPVHELITIEQQVSEINGYPEERRSIAESIDRSDDRPVGTAVSWPEVAHMGLTPAPVPNAASAEGAIRQIPLKDGSEDIRTIAPTRDNAVRWLVQFDEDTRLLVSSSNLAGQAYEGRIAYALE